MTMRTLRRMTTRWTRTRRCNLLPSLTGHALNVNEQRSPNGRLATTDLRKLRKQEIPRWCVRGICEHWIEPEDFRMNGQMPKHRV